MRLFRLLAEFRLFMSGGENQTIVFSTNKDILLIGLRLFALVTVSKSSLEYITPRGYQTVEMASFQHTFEFVSKFYTFSLVMTFTPDSAPFDITFNTL